MSSILGSRRRVIDFWYIFSLDEDLVETLRASASHANGYDWQQNKSFAKKLMLNEWLIDIPEDFDKWLMVPHPKAKRCLIVAAHVSFLSYSGLPPLPQIGKKLWYLFSMARNTILSLFSLFKTENCYFCYLYCHFCNKKANFRLF